MILNIHYQKPPRFINFTVEAEDVKQQSNISSNTVLGVEFSRSVHLKIDVGQDEKVITIITFLELLRT